MSCEKTTNISSKTLFTWCIHEIILSLWNKFIYRKFNLFQDFQRVKSGNFFRNCIRCYSVLLINTVPLMIKNIIFFSYKVRLQVAWVKSILKVNYSLYTQVTNGSSLEITSLEAAIIMVSRFSASSSFIQNYQVNMSSR